MKKEKIKASKRVKVSGALVQMASLHSYHSQLCVKCLIVGWCGQFLFFVVPCQFSQDIGEWPENQILIPDWTYFYCPGATLSHYRTYLPLGWCWKREKIDWQEACKFDCRLVQMIFIFCCPSQEIGEWPQNQILIPDWTHFHCLGATLHLH